MEHITVLVDIEELELGRHLVLPFFIDTVEIEVAYEYTPGEKATMDSPGEVETVELYEANILVCYMDKGANFIPTNEQSETILGMIDSDDIETAIWEARDAQY